MPSAVDICNLALSRLGDSATVTTIDPPEGSAQAEHCARFYPLARDTLLEAHQWAFTTRRAALALLAEEPGVLWTYAYAAPSGMLDVISVLPPGAEDEVQETQPFALEMAADGSPAILTNQQDAWARYTVAITDPTKFPAQFVDCLSWLLASHLAGPILKGDAGVAAAKSCFNIYRTQLSAAVESDANQKHTRPQHIPTWVAVR